MRLVVDIWKRLLKSSTPPGQMSAYLVTAKVFSCKNGRRSLHSLTVEKLSKLIVSTVSGVCRHLLPFAASF
jgi:hypothetical protein